MDRSTRILRLGTYTIPFLLAHGVEVAEFGEFRPALLDMSVSYSCISSWRRIAFIELVNECVSRRDRGAEGIGEQKG
jgi:hypothetical protein